MEFSQRPKRIWVRHFVAHQNYVVVSWGIAQAPKHFARSRHVVNLNVIGVHSQVVLCSCNVPVISFEVKNFEWICAASSVGIVVIESALEGDRQRLEIPFLFDYIIICARFQCRNSSVFVADASNDHNCDWQTVFTYVVEQRQAIAVAQVHVCEHEIDRI